MRSVVLCYHAVSATWQHRLCISPEQLLGQVRAARRLGQLHITFDDGFRNILQVLPALQEFDLPITLFICSGYADRGGAPLLIAELATDNPDDLENLRTLAWAELRSLAAGGVEIGAHTVTHAHLLELDDHELAREVRESKRRIEAELERPCPAFAYPYGEYDARVRDAVRDAGYERAYALRRRRGDPYALPRVDLYRKDSLLRTLAKAGPLRVPLRSPL